MKDQNTQQVSLRNEQNDISPAEKESPLSKLIAKSDPIILPMVDTSNWKEYENRAWGIRFKYPDGWMVNPIASSNPFDAIICLSSTVERYRNVESAGECGIQVRINVESNLTFLNSDGNEGVKFYSRVDDGEKFLWRGNQDIQSVYGDIGGCKVAIIQYFRPDFIQSSSTTNETLNVFHGVIETIRPF